MGQLLSSTAEHEIEPIVGGKRVVIFIEGNISAGKSTLIRTLREKGYMVEEEAVHIWTQDYVDENGKNILDLFYSDMNKNAFEMQIASLNTKWKSIRKVAQSQQRVVFVERSLLTDIKTFAFLMHENKSLSKIQWKLYRELHEALELQMEEFFADIEVRYLYLRTDPIICLGRLQSRNRKEESSIKLPYLEQLHAELDEWLVMNAQSCIDGAKNKEEVLEAVLNYVEALRLT